jgi:hypothetical protein
MRLHLYSANRCLQFQWYCSIFLFLTCSFDMGDWFSLENSRMQSNLNMQWSVSWFFPFYVITLFPAFYFLTN